MPVRPLRLSLQLGVASLSNFALGFGLVVPALAVFPVGVYYFGSLDIFWFALALIAMSLCAIRRGWRLRPSDLAFDDRGLRVHGGPKDGAAVAWSDVLDASVRDFKDKEDFKDKSYRLLVHLRGGAFVELAQTDDEDEARSLSAIRDALKGRIEGARAPADAMPAGEAGGRDATGRPTVPHCSSCGAPVVPEAYDDLRCRTCSAALTLPDDVRARVQAARALPVDLARATRKVNALLDQPGAAVTTLLVMVALVPMALAWPISGVTIVRAYLAGHLNNALAAGAVALPFLLIVDGFFLARGRMVDRRAVLALAFSHSANPPTRAGDSPSCHACGAPLPSAARTESIARCVYCGADNVTAIDLRLPANAAKSAARSLDEALADRQRERARWRLLTLASVPFVALSVWLLVVLHRAG
jgi:DNA-directed RNA polymerase subunit RPC12/RpoP